MGEAKKFQGQNPIISCHQKDYQSKKPPPTKKMDTESLPSHFEKHFIRAERIEDFPTSFLQYLSKREKISAVRDLKNNKASGPAE